jgi:diguanylate cyclase (GGDEF)-like protein/PAS domain S-box-containing protein
MNELRQRHGRLIAAVIALIVTFALRQSGALTRAEWSASDLYSHWLQHEVESDIVIVGIDEQSLTALKHWPWPRSTHARLLERLAPLHPKHVFLDIDFSTQSYGDEDRRLADALSRLDGSTLILPAFLQGASTAGNRSALTRPLPEFGANAAIGSVNLVPAADSLVRDVNTLWNSSGTPLAGVFNLLSERRLPAGKMLIDYSLAPSSFGYVPYVDLLEGRVDPSELRGKTVMVGAMASELGDMQPVPVYSSLPGVVVQALAVQTARSGPVVPLDRSLGATLLVLWALLIAGAFRKRGWRLNATIAGAFVALAIVVTLFARYRHVQVELVPLLLVVGVCFLSFTLRSLDAETLRAFRLSILANRHEALLRSIVDSSTECILCVDATGLIRSANRSAGVLLSATEDTLKGRTIAQIVPDLPEAGDAKVMESLRNRICEGNALALDGSQIPIEFSVTPVQTKDQSLYTVLLRDLRERKAHEARLQYQATHDSLTGLPNRHALTQALQKRISSGGGGEPFALCLLDLTRFKEVNDTLGHSFGDFVLCEVAKRFQSVLGTRGELARMGGDEFVILTAQELSRDDLWELARALADSLKVPVHSDGLAIEVGVNIGIACYPGDACDHHELLKNADIAMYSAKRRATGCTFYDAADNANSIRSLEMLADLRVALGRGDLQLHYQPKVSLQSGRVESVEALLRWQHERYGAVSPLEVIPLAESSDLLRPLTDWTITEALRQSRQWAAQGQPTRIAINLSAHMLQDLSLPERLSAELSSHEVLPDCLEIEITESAMMLDVDRALTIVNAIRELGVHVAVDDYGTGFSSLRYLRDLSIDCLKLDRSFVADLESNGDNRIIVESTLALARALQLQVVAEGVSTSWQVEYLRKNGCDFAQGFFYSRALNASDCATWMRDHNASPPRWDFAPAGGDERRTA